MAIEVFPSSLHFTLERNIETFRNQSTAEFRAKDRLQRFPRPYHRYTLETENMTNDERGTLEGFFKVHMFSDEDRFHLADPKDNTVTDENFGVGDGSETDFQLTRTFTYQSKSVEFPQGHIQPDTETIYKNGNEVSSSDYTLDNQTGVVTFDTAPSDGDQLKADYDFYRLCVFGEDTLSFEDVTHSAQSARYEIIEVPG